MKVIAELDESEKRIEVHFTYDYAIKERVKRIPGAKFVAANKGGPYWTVPADLETGRALRQAFGDSLTLTPRLVEWGRRQVAQANLLETLGSAVSAPLDRLDGVLPDLGTALKPFQRAAAAFIAACPHPLVADQPGLGKTLEAIAGIFEAGTDAGPNLVVAPLTSLDTVWRYELERWQSYPVFLAGEGTRKEREKIINQFLECAGPKWLIVNPDMVRYRRPTDEELVAWLERKTGQPASEFKMSDGSIALSDKMLKEAKSAKAVLIPQYPQLHDVQWNNVIIDECHKNAFRGLKSAGKMSLSARGMMALKAGKRIAMSGTPFGGKEENVWGILHFLRPDKFSSKWDWAARWLEITDNGWGKEIGGVKPGKQKEFDDHLIPYMLRRTKDEVLKELPPKQRVDVWCTMVPKQAKQYDEFAANAELGLKEGRIVASNVLAEYTRLKQLASSECTLREESNGKYKLVPTGESGKLLALFERLDEQGIFDDDSEDQVVIFSQFAETVDLVYDQLEKKGVKVLKITGDVSRKGERAALQRSFQAGEARAMVMTTTAGGVAITLDRASHVHILDETWDPDNEEQAEDRCHRASRIHQVTVYRYYTKNTVEEHIRKITLKKANVNKQILDASREGRLKLR